MVREGIPLAFGPPPLEIPHEHKRRGRSRFSQAGGSWQGLCVVTSTGREDMEP
jgi:hypothetical protein